jgi:hypothetical protein
MRKPQVWAALLLAMMSASLNAGQPENVPASATALFRVSLAPRAVAFAAMPAAWQAGGQSPDERGQRAPARPTPKRSKGMIIGGLALIGGGAYMLIANPDLTQQYLPTANGGLVKQGYHARLIGGVLAGTGGVVLWQGLKRR